MLFKHIKWYPYINKQFLALQMSNKIHDSVHLCFATASLIFTLGNPGFLKIVKAIFSTIIQYLSS